MKFRMCFPENGNSLLSKKTPEVTEARSFRELKKLRVDEYLNGSRVTLYFLKLYVTSIRLLCFREADALLFTLWVINCGAVILAMCGR